MTKKNKKDKKATLEAEQKKIEDFLKRIRKITSDGDYIFRGENKKRRKIASTFYRYLNTIVGRAGQQLKRPFNFDPIKKELRHQLGKIAQRIDFDGLESSLKENILNQLAQENRHSLNVSKVQEDFVFQEMQKYLDFENEIDTLAELQHYGGATNLIDFSHDIAVALFFACDGEPKEKGRLIIYRADAEDIISPKKSQNNRTISQKSVFVQRNKGYIDEKDVKIISIPKYLKPLLLPYVNNYFGIRTETLYGDLHGYIKNQKMHRKAHEHMFAGLILVQRKQLQEAIKSYDEAIKLKLDFTQAYYFRGNARVLLYIRVAKKDSKTIENGLRDIKHAIKLDPNNAVIYNYLCWAFVANGEQEKARDACAKAIELKPDYAEAYISRGIINRLLGNAEEVMPDFQVGLQLARKQGKKRIISYAQEEIDKLSDNDSDSTSTPPTSKSD